MKKIKRTGIYALILCLWAVGNILAFRYYLAKTINLKTTYIAKHDIPPRTQIQTEESNNDSSSREIHAGIYLE